MFFFFFCRLFLWGNPPPKKGKRALLGDLLYLSLLVPCQSTGNGCRVLFPRQVSSNSDLCICAFDSKQNECLCCLAVLKLGRSPTTCFKWAVLLLTNKIVCGPTKSANLFPGCSFEVPVDSCAPKSDPRKTTRVSWKQKQSILSNLGCFLLPCFFVFAFFIPLSGLMEKPTSWQKVNVLTSKQHAPSSMVSNTPKPKLPPGILWDIGFRV